MSKKTTSNCGFNEVFALVAKSSCVGTINLDPEGCSPAVEQRRLCFGSRTVLGPLGDPWHVLHALLLASALLVGSELRNTHWALWGLWSLPQPCPVPASVSLLLASAVFNELI